MNHVHVDVEIRPRTARVMSLAISSCGQQVRYQGTLVTIVQKPHGIPTNTTRPFISKRRHRHGTQNMARHDERCMVISIGVPRSKFGYRKDHYKTNSGCPS
jgi:hypothetical protein